MNQNEDRINATVRMHRDEWEAIKAIAQGLKMRGVRELLTAIASGKIKLVSNFPTQPLAEQDRRLLGESSAS